MADAVAPARPAAITAVPVRHRGRWVAAIVVLALATYIVYTVVTAVQNDHTARGSGWAAVGFYLFNGLIFRGILVTLELTALAMVVGIVLGVILAVMRLSPNPVMSWVSWLYIWFFRGTPVLVQIFFWFNLNLVLKSLDIGIPFTPLWLHANTNTLIPPFMAALLGLGLNEAAYMAEIVRAGMISVEHGQTEAAQALGMNRGLVMRRIVLPQAMRVIIPPTGNETISMLKTTSLAFGASVTELFTRQQQIATATYDVLELLIVASIWYLVMTSILTVGQYYIERRFARGTLRGLPPTPWQRLRRMLFTFHAPPPAQQELPVLLPRGH
ncbi:MAG TPA: amino acid ABC transporter permease [Candidatus Dormibacteraeota bacterium]|nr:amino acid ABC transporter permease [Candidatus Dormibacteraeota bacterium]